MPVEVVMPRLSDTMEEGTVLKWLKQVGDEVKKGEPLLEVATDKANMEMEAFESGVLDRILVNEGETVPIGTQIALLRKPGEAPSGGQQLAQAQPTSQAAAPAPPAAQTTQPSQAPAEAPPAAPEAPEEGERVKASPLARRLAEEHDLDLRQITGTGPGGRVTKEDVDEFLARRPAQPAAQAGVPTAAQPSRAPEAPLGQPGAAAPAASQPLTRMQETIVRRMVESKQTVPHFYVTVEIDMGEASRLRRSANAAAGGSFEISYNDMVIKAAALTLRQFPQVNSFYQNGRLQVNQDVNVGMALALPDGLVVPVIHNADAKSLRQIASASREIVERARTGRLQPDDYVGGTFTVSNLGMYDVDEFAAIINPPQSGILAVGAVKPKPVVLDGEIKVAERMRVTLSVDHRVYYGATAAQFLKELKRLLENPLEMVL